MREPVRSLNKGIKSIFILLVLYLMREYFLKYVFSILLFYIFIQRLNIKSCPLYKVIFFIFFKEVKLHQIAILLFDGRNIFLSGKIGIYENFFWTLLPSSFSLFLV